MNVIKINSGQYSVSNGDRSVTVTKTADGWWIAVADWKEGLYTDPIRSKDVAVKHATYMLQA